jgi:hypothetical protein
MSDNYIPRVNDRVRSTRTTHVGTIVTVEHTVTYVSNRYISSEDQTFYSDANWTHTLIERGFIDEPKNVGAFVHVTYRDGRVFLFVRTAHLDKPWFPIEIRLSDGRSLTPGSLSYTWETLKKGAENLEKGLPPRG